MLGVCDYSVKREENDLENSHIEIQNYKIQEINNVN